MSGRSTASRSDSMKAPLLGRGARLSGGSNKVRYTILHVCADGVKVGYTCSLRSPGRPRETTTPRLCRLSICRERCVRMPWRVRFSTGAPTDTESKHPASSQIDVLSGAPNTAVRNLLQGRITANVPHNSNVTKSVYVGTPNSCNKDHLPLHVLTGASQGTQDERTAATTKRCGPTSSRRSSSRRTAWW